MRRLSPQSIAVWSAFLLLLGLFVAARSWDVHPVVFADDETVRLLGVDPWFHVRHAEYSRDHFPGLLRNDPGARYPGHGKQNVSGLFNLGMGGAALIAGWFSDDPLLLDRVAAWTPVVLAGLAFLLLFLFARRLGGPLMGLGACLVFLLFPGSTLPRSLLGFADQHVLEFLLALGSTTGLVLAVRGACADGKGLAWRPIRTLLHALPFATFFYSWLGAPIYIVPMAAAVFAGILLVVIAGASSHGLWMGCARFFGAVALIQIVVILFAPDLIMPLRAGIERWILAGMVALAGLPALYFYLVSRLPDRIPGWVQALVTFVVFLGACSFFFLQTSQGRFFYGWLSGVRGLNVAEQGDILWNDLWIRFGVPGILAAVSIPLVLVARRPFVEKLSRLMVCMFGLAVFFLWLRTHDFDYAPPIFIALMAVVSAEQIVMWLKVIHGRFVRLGVTVAVCAGMLVPFGTLRPWWMGADQAENLPRHRTAWFAAMEWMRTNTPRPFPTPVTNVVTTVSDSASYGVMSSWDDGNFIAYRGRRLPVLSRFPGSRDGRWMTSTSEEESLETMCPRCSGNEHVRYAVVTAQLAAELFLPKAIAASRPPQMQIEGYWEVGNQRVSRITYGDDYNQALIARLVRGRGEGLLTYRLVWESDESAIIYLRQTTAAGTVALQRQDTDTDAGRQFAELVAGRTFLQIPGGYLYDFTRVPQVLIFEIVRPEENS